MSVLIKKIGASNGVGGNMMIQSYDISCLIEESKFCNGRLEIR